jgi:hypothetical protein
MYVTNRGFGDRDERTRFQGFSDDVPDLQRFQKSLVAIRAALELNPRTGYVKGSPPRKQLDDAFESVPQCSAFELATQLLKGEGPLEKLFRYRLARPSQRAMFLVLMRKVNECQQQKREELRRIQEEQRRIQEEQRRIQEEQRRRNEEICRNLMSKDVLIAEFCRLTGEGSDQCRKLRSGALKTREQIRMQGIRCP